MKIIKIFPVLTLVFFLSTLWLFYERNLVPPTPDKTEITATLSSPEVESEDSSSTPALSVEEQAEFLKEPGAIYLIVPVFLTTPL